ncbi:MAG: hypothetical protein GY940_16695 [bacterium]|nr:hypothetical protein [bacterium]
MKNIFFFFIVVPGVLIIANPFPIHVHASNGFERELAEISKTMAEKIALTGKKKVAVMDFSDLQGNATRLGQFIAEEFSVSLAGSGKGFGVVDRNHLKTILRDYKLSATGLTGPETARKIGEVTGAEALVTGTLTPFGKSARLAVKILDTRTLVIIDANSASIALTGGIEELLNQKNRKQPTRLRGYRKRKRLAKAIQTKEELNFKFEVIGCEVSGELLICKLLITNKSPFNRWFYINNNRLYGRTVVFDDFGNEYNLIEAHIANTMSDFTKITFMRKVLVSGVRTKVELITRGISRDASMVSSLEISCASPQSHNTFNVNLRNIPISR